MAATDTNVMERIRRALFPSDPNIPDGPWQAASAIARQYNVVALSIPSGSVATGPVDFRLYAMAQLVMPQAFTGTQLSFQTSLDGSTFQDLYDSTNTKVTLGVAASFNYDLPTALAGAQWWKAVSNSAEGSIRALTAILKG